MIFPSRAKSSLHLLVWFGVAGLLWNTPAFSEPSAMDRAAAQRLFDAALFDLEKGNATEACPKLEESQRLDPAMGTQFNLADCYEKLGRTASAWVNFTEVADAALKSGEAERERVARERAQAVSQRLSYLTITVLTPVEGLVVKRDGTELGRGLWGVETPVDPGVHQLVVTAPHKKNYETRVDVPREGGRAQVTIPALEDAPTAAAAPADAAPVVPPGPPPPPTTTSDGSNQRIWALVSAGAGVVAVGVGTALLVSAQSKYSDSERYCDGQNQCSDRKGVTLREDAISLADWATLPLGLGVVGLGVGTWLWFTAPSSPKEGPVASLTVSPGGWAISGRF